MVEVKSRVHLLSLNETVPQHAYTVAIWGASLGGPAQLSTPVVEQLIDVERRGLDTVLVAGNVGDLETSVAKLCRRVCVADRETKGEALQRWGRELVISVADQSDEALRKTLRRLPKPESRTFARRLQSWLRR